MTARIGLLTLLTSLWWLAGLWAQGGYGLNILKFTETLQVVSLSSLPSEVLRGLGYWFFYGIDRVGHWTEGSVPYTQNLGLLAVSFAIPILALFAAMCVRWKHRAYFVILTVVGVAVAVGANPYDDPSLLGGWFKSFAESSSFGLALRSTSRAVPLVALGLAVLLGVGVNALATMWQGRGRQVEGVPIRTLVVAGLVIVLAVVNLPALWTGAFYTEDLTRDEAIPQYWSDAIAALDAAPHDTRVLEIPGADFAAYRWGQTIDPITPGLMDRPYVARELVPWGSAASADLLNALDHRIQEGTLDPSALAPVARLMNAGSIVYRADLETDRYDLVRAVPLWRLLTAPEPKGLGPPQKYGNSLGPPLRVTQDDEIQLALPAGASDPPPVSIFPVDGTRPIIRSADASAPLIVSGDGEGLVDLAGIGALNGSGVVLYSGTFANDPARLRAEVGQPNAVLVVTDSNRKRARRWTSVRDTVGETERIHQKALVKDENDNRLDVFPDAGTDAQTVVETPGVAVSTSKYGDPGFYEPEYRGARAFDGDVNTQWQVGAHSKVIGQQIRLELDRPITTGQVNLVQPQVGPRQRYLTKVDLSFDGGAPITVDLSDASRSPGGQTVSFPSRTFERLDITIADTNVGDESSQPYSNSVGFAEIRLHDDVPGAQDVRADEIVRMPTDLVDAAGARADDRPLVYDMTRLRTVVVPPHTSQDEVAMVRRFTVPDALDLRRPGHRPSGHRRARPRARRGPRHPGCGRRRHHRVVVAAPPRRHPVARVVRVRRRSCDRVEHGLRRTGRSVARRDHPAAGDLRPPRPAGRRRRQALRAHAAPHRRRWRVAHRRPPGGHRRRGGRGAGVGPGAVRPAHRFRRARHRHRRARGRDPRLPRAGAVDDAGRPRRGGAARRPARRHAGGAPGRLPDRSAHRRRRGAGRRAPGLDRRRGRGQARRPAGVPGAGRGRRGHARRGRPRGAIRARHAERHRRRRLGAGLGRRGRGHGARCPRRAAPLGHAAPGRARGDAARPGHEQGQHQDRPVGQRRAAGHAVLAGAGRERERGLGGERRGQGRRRVDAGRRLRERMARAPDGGHVLGDAPVDAATHGVDRAGGVGARSPGVPLPRAASPPGSAPPDDDVPDDDRVLRFTNPLVAAGTEPRPLVVVAAALGVGIVGALLASWWVGLLAAVLVAVVARVPRLRFLIALGAPLALAACVAYVIVQQYRHNYPSDLDWPTQFDGINDIAWLAVILLLADVVVEAVRRHGGHRPAPAPPDDT